MKSLFTLVALVCCQASAWAEEVTETAGASETASATPPPKTLLPKPSSMPWVTVLRSGVGVDDNIDLSRFGSKATALTAFDLNGQIHLREDLRLAMRAGYQKNLPFTAAGDGEVGVFAGYVRELPAKLQLRVSAQLAYRQERSVFADGAILQNKTVLQKIFENSLAGVLAYRLGSVDLEGGAQGDFEDQSGGVEEDSRLLGVHAMASLRYTLRDRVAFRARYTYEYSDTTGLSSRNLAGGIDGVGRTLLIGLNRIRFSARARIAQRSSAYVRYDYVSAIDNYSGYLDSHEHVAFAATTLALGKLTIEGNGEVARRNFYQRTPSIENPDTDTTINASLRVDGWYLPPFAGLRRLGLFALYRADYVRADPTGLVFARHIGLGGVSGQFGQER